MKKIVKAVSLVLVCALMLSLLGVSALAEEKKTVRMWTFLDPTNTTNGRSVALQQIIDKFEAEHPDIDIVVEPQDWASMSTKFFAAHAAGNAPDICWIIMDEMGAALDLNALEPLENLAIGKWSEEEIADIDDAFWQFGVRDGKHYQITFSRNYVTIYYRADLFEQNGIEIPRTWDELIAAAQKLTGYDEKLGVQRYGFGLALATEDVDPQLMTNMILSEQGTLFNEDGTANWANETGVKALETMCKFITEYGISPETAVSTTGEDLWVDFEAGKLAMMSGGAIRVNTVRSNCVYDPSAVQIMLWPTADGEGHAPGVINGWCVGVWSKSKVKEEAGLFLEAMVSPEADKLWVELGGQPAMRQSTLENAKEYIEKNEFLTVISEGFLTAGWPQPTDFPVSSWKNDMNNAAQKVLVDKMSPMEALEAVAQDFNMRNQ
ncbi:MAG: sugar ABC transporter substrate-binding protein [Clostridiales bacterium]|nr:sugar ABC transporter substrate-binding protein [Clostridiales bacterium]